MRAMPEAAAETATGARVARDPDAPFVSVRGLAHYFDVSKPFLNRVIEG